LFRVASYFKYSEYPLVFFDAFGCLTKQEKHSAKNLRKMLSKMDPALRARAFGALGRFFPLFLPFQAEKANFQFS